MLRFCQRLLWLSLLVSSPTLFAQRSLQYVNPPGLPVSRTYTQVVIVPTGRVAHISGQVSANATGEIINKGDFRAQTKQVYENLKIALAAVGATFADVIKTTTYVVNSDAGKIGVVREIRNQYYTRPGQSTRSANSPGLPASTYVGVQALYDKDVLIEIEAIAVIK